ncbi:conserved hypothetical protein [Ricinus communis]|uniref:Secreted protein n=1 Tax=Ricinus communis TaxID=3988 RepID=B9SPH7_RICCO|nr:conserved hypothetical protein [Ricinus communis]
MGGQWWLAWVSVASAGAGAGSRGGPHMSLDNKRRSGLWCGGGLLVLVKDLARMAAQQWAGEYPSFP